LCGGHMGAVSVRGGRRAGCERACARAARAHAQQQAAERVRAEALEREEKR